LHPDKGSFDLKPIGKIAGVKEITFVGLNIKEPASPSLLMKAVGGGWIVQALRELVYFFAPLICIGLIAAVKGSLHAAKTRAEMGKREEQVLQFKAHRNPKDEEILPNWEWVFRDYMLEGKRAIEGLMDIAAVDNLSVNSLLLMQFEDKLRIAHAIINADGKRFVEPRFKAFVVAFHQHLCNYSAGCRFSNTRNFEESMHGVHQNDSRRPKGP